MRINSTAAVPTDWLLLHLAMTHMRLEGIGMEEYGSDAVSFVVSNFFANPEAAAFLVGQLAPALGRRSATQIWIAGNAFDRSDAW